MTNARNGRGLISPNDKVDIGNHFNKVIDDMLRPELGIDVVKFSYKPNGLELVIPELPLEIRSIRGYAVKITPRITIKSLIKLIY